MYATTCDVCSAPVTKHDENCWRCNVDLTPACGRCRNPVSLSADMCMHCEDVLSEIIIIRKPTITTA